ncbi:transcription antitermination protein NusB [Fervidicella metallireducens AeB]|uniref:Transcription antitermination protein NusB n=1 Tax=Fervidicella metallireducens AeB TaxID=1403537 RepID=A0A017RY46_9CLOT|nr:transcription antitermination factor NusB [Fervidicella metallireducens]EYE89698.1 transcription antitermination protein NusB [Fervidicella metallireducens AeB]
MSRKWAREAAMKVLYQMDVTSIDSKEALDDFEENVEVKFSQEEKEFIFSCVKGTEENITKIDEYIERYSKGWKINRIAKVDLAIMRLAIYEMLYREDVPNVVAVNEAIELAKKFGGDNSPNFVNGILGNVIKEV